MLGGVFLCPVAHETAGAACTRCSLRPLIGEGGNLTANLGRNAPRDREVVHGDLPSLHAPLRVAGRGRGVCKLAPLAASLLRHPQPLRASFARLGPTVSRGEGRSCSRWRAV